MKKFLVFIVLVIAMCGNAQEAPENFKFSSMITLNDFPIGNVTGVPDISIPLYTCQTAGDLSVALNLQYNLQGSINSNILGSQFGDAWNLTMGGVISRDVNGRRQPAEATFPTTSTGYFDFDEHYYDRNALATDRATTSDLYDFDVMGLRGKFIIKKSGSSFIAEVIESNDYLKVNVYRSSTSSLIDKIEIIDKKGMLYTFTYQSDIYPNMCLVTRKIEQLDNPFDPFPEVLPGGLLMHPAFDRGIAGGPNNYYARIVPGPQFWKQLMLTKVNDKDGKLLLEMKYDEANIKISDPSTEWINGISNFSSVGKPYLKEINIINIGSIYFNNNISTTNIRNFTDSYTRSIQIRDLKGALLKEFEFQYSPISKVYKKILGPQSHVNYYFKKLYLDYIKEYNSSKTQFKNILVNYNNTFGDELNDYGYYHQSTTKATSTGGSIERITYPTGGTVYYQFETHDYLARYDNTTLNGRGLRLKRTAHFIKDQGSGYLYTTPAITNAEQLITYEYKDDTDANKSSGRVRDEILYLTGGLTDEQNSLLYQKVKVSKTGVGYKEFFYKITPNNSSVNNSNYNFYRRQLEESKTFDVSGSLLDKNNFQYQYSFLSSVFNTDGYKIDPFVVSEEHTSSYYEGSQSYREIKNTNYNSSNRQISSSTLTDNLGVVNKSEFDYNIINNTIVNARIRNYVDNSLTDQSLNTYGSSADFLKTEFKTPEMAAYEKVGNENNKYINGLLMGYLQPDGTPVTLVYGYLGTQIIAKLVNVDANVFYSGSYQSILNNLDMYSTQYHANYSEANLKTSLNSLRTSFPNALVTTYTYKPMVGISSITDENGKTSTYEYDTFNRLANVKDYLGNILKEYKYNFTN